MHSLIFQQDFFKIPLASKSIDHVTTADVHAIVFGTITKLAKYSETHTVEPENRVQLSYLDEDNDELLILEDSQLRSYYDGYAKNPSKLLAVVKMIMKSTANSASSSLSTPSKSKNNSNSNNNSPIFNVGADIHTARSIAFNTSLYTLSTYVDDKGGIVHLSCNPNCIRHHTYVNIDVPVSGSYHQRT